jgi:hypothetical protein
MGDRAHLKAAILHQSAVKTHLARGQQRSLGARDRIHVVIRAHETGRAAHTPPSTQRANVERRCESTSAPAVASRELPAPSRPSIRRPRWTSTNRTRPASFYDCSARTKQESVRGRSARSELVRSGRLGLGYGDARNQASLSGKGPRRVGPLSAFRWPEVRLFHAGTSAERSRLTST